MRTIINIITICIVMCISTTVYAQESMNDIPTLEKERDKTEKSEMELSNKITERSKQIRKEGGSQLNDPKMKKLKAERDSLRRIENATKEKILNIRLNSLLKSDRNKQVYHRIMNANNEKHAIEIMVNYIDSLDKVYIDSLSIKNPDFRDKYYFPDYPTSLAILETYTVFRQVVHRNFKYEGGKEKLPQYMRGRND